MTELPPGQRLPCTLHEVHSAARAFAFEYGCGIRIRVITGIESESRAGLRASEVRGDHAAKEHSIYGGDVTNDGAQYRHPVAVAPESALGRLVVVCDDGSVWKWIDEAERWQEIAPIPGSDRAKAPADPIQDGR